jgi:AcrR family transcriptional regulator
MTVKPKSMRGRPRDPATRKAILAAAARLIETGGLGAVTMEAVARRSGAGKPTIYRYWPNREALAMAALMAAAGPSTDVRPSASAIEDLRRQLRKVADLFASPRGRNAVLMTASADPDSELSKAFRTQVMLASREEGRVLLERAIATGEVRADLDTGIALDMIYGPIFYRLLIGHAPAGVAFTHRLIEEAMRGFRRPSAFKR